MNVPAPKQSEAAIVETVLIGGDLKNLTEAQRVRHYLDVCNSLGLNYRTVPFAYITLNGKLVLYPKRDCTDQLRKINGISVEVVKQQDGKFLAIGGNLLTVHVRATDKTGRTDEDFGVVPFTTAAVGELAANTIMKAITKAKRRVTLSISGLGFPDETELEFAKDAPRSEPALEQLEKAAEAAP